MSQNQAENYDAILVCVTNDKGLPSLYDAALFFTHDDSQIVL